VRDRAFRLSSLHRQVVSRAAERLRRPGQLGDQLIQFAHVTRDKRANTWTGGNHGLPFRRAWHHKSCCDDITRVGPKTAPVNHVNHVARRAVYLCKRRHGKCDSVNRLRKPSGLASRNGGTVTR